MAKRISNKDVVSGSGNFTRRIEDFCCEQCQTVVSGNGYTNHCPNCLYSKHVDQQPGDRAADCGGLMVPRSVVQEHGRYVITHICQQCGFSRRQKSSPNDNFEALVSVVRGGSK